MGCKTRLALVAGAALWVNCLCLVDSAGSQLQCHPETLTYSYVNEIKLWGAAEQTLRVTCHVDLDCNGVSDLSNSSLLAFDYVLHLYNLTVSQGKVDPHNVAKLCKDSGEACTVGEESGHGTTGTPGEEEGTPNDVTAHDMPQFALPVRFTQAETGTVLRVQFMEKDLEIADVVNLKKGIISSLQTRILRQGETTERETDSTGSHATRFRVRKEGMGVLVEKEYAADEDESPRAKLTRTASVRVNARALVQHGEIEDSQGEITTKLEDDEFAEDDPDSNPGISVEAIVQSYSRFQLKLLTKLPRSNTRRKRMTEYGHISFLTTSLQMENLGSEDIESKYEKLSAIYEEVQLIPIPEAIQRFTTSGDEQHLSVLKTGLMLESELGSERIRRKFDGHDVLLVDHLVQATYQLMSECQTKWDMCRIILELYSLGGGRKAEEVFEFLLSTESTLDKDHQMDVVNLLSFLERPSDRLILSLIHHMSQLSEDSDMFGATLLALGSLAGQTSINEHTKSIVRAIILKELEPITPGQCSDDERYVDALEAVGNMGDRRFIERLLEVDFACGGNKVMRVAFLHATRQLFYDERVQQLMLDTLISFDCEISEDLINLLLEAIQEQQLDESLSEQWPLSGFNQFDQAMANFLLDPQNKMACVRSLAIRYFGRKLSPAAKNVAKLLMSGDDNFGRHKITKRGIKKHSSCSKWSDFNGRYSSIALPNTFKAQSKKYNKRRSCLAHFGLGPSKANVNVYCGVFAGCRTPASSFQNRVFAKAVAKGKILKKKFSLATVYIYAQTKGSGKASGKVYAKVGKKTLINKKISGKFKNSKKVFAAPSIKIPLAKIPVYITKIDVDLKLSASLVMTTDLKTCSKTELCLTFKPTAKAKATASASISLALVRAGADLNLNLNYYVKGTVRTKACKFPCASLSHGHDKNSVNLEFYYQIKSKVKVKVKLFKLKFKVKLKWGKKKTWKPSSLKWKIGKAKESKIYSNC